MASNSGTGLIDSSGKRNLLYRATIAFTNLKTRCKWNDCFQQCSDKHHISILIPHCLQPSSHQQPAMISASAMQVRRKFESTTQCRQFAMNHAKDTIATHNSRISERRWLSTRNIDGSRLFLRINDCSDDQN